MDDYCSSSQSEPNGSPKVPLAKMRTMIRSTVGANKKFIIMLHKVSLRTFNFLLKGGIFFDTHPLRWNKDKTRMIVNTSWFTWYRWKLQVSFIFMYTAFVYYRLYDSLVNMKIPAEQCVIQIFYAISCFYYTTNNYNFVAREMEIAEFVSIFFKFDRLFPAKPHQIQLTKRFGKNLLAFLVAGLSNGLFQGPCFLYFSKNRNFIFSVVEPFLQPETAYWAKFPFALLEMWMSTLTWCGSLFNTFIWFAIAHCIPLWTEAMRYNDTKKLSRPMTREMYYRCLQCLMVQFNDCYAWFAFIGVKMSAFFGLICVLYGSLRFYGKIPIVGYAVLPLSVFMGFLYAFLMFPAAGHASDALNEMLNGWSKIGLSFLDRKERVIDMRKRSPGANNIIHVSPAVEDSSNAITVANRLDNPEQGSMTIHSLQRSPAKINRFKLNASFIKSCPTVGFRVGGFYCVTTGTTFTFCDMVINQTINCLLSF